MHYIFKKLIIKNFLSFKFAEITLNDNGFVLIDGKNIDSIDKATSNGAGKSTIFNALCWVLTGRTCSGNNSNIRRLGSDEDTFVSIDFVCNNSECKLTRIVPLKGSKQLEIIVDGENKTNKGIRNTEDVLTEFFPEFTFEFISNSFIFAQGMPCKITNFWQGKRKEILESLTGVDFIIESFKLKLNNRKQYIQNSINATSDKLLVDETSLKFNTDKLTKLESDYEFYQQINFLSLNDEICTLENNLNKLTTSIDTLHKVLLDKNTTLANLQSKINTETSNLKLEYLTQIDPLKNKLSAYKVKADFLTTRIKQNESIKDVCPTCHQKIIGIIKNDMSKEKFELSQLISEAKLLDTKIKNIKQIYKDKLNEKIQQLNNEKQCVESEIEKIKLSIKTKSAEKLAISEAYKSKQHELAVAEINKSKLLDLKHEIKETQNLINNLQTQINEAKIQKENLLKHQLINTKMISFCKREFRGVILTKVLTYIDVKLKEYSSIAFNHNDLCIKLSGNNIELMYQNKSYENLSGGEKQKVDILLQLAIKDLLLQMKNFSSNILVFDEVFDNLDTTSANTLLTLFLNVSTTVSSFYLVTHRTAELEIPNDYTWTVIKSNDISQIQV